MVSQVHSPLCAVDGSPHVKGNPKAVTFNLPATCPVRGPLDRSTQSAGDAEAAEPCKGGKKGS